MAADRPPPKPLALDPLDPPTPAGRAAADAPGGAASKYPPAPRMQSDDPYLARALQEFERGIVDEALWRGASAQSGRDDALIVAAYLRARATSLQMQERARRADARASAPVAPATTSAAPAAAATPAAKRARLASPGMLKLAIGAVAALCVAAILLVVVWPDDEPAAAAAVASARPKTSAASTPRVNEQAAIQPPAAPEADPAAVVAQKVAELEATGNWNVQVLYAGEWTRKQPENAQAWNRLGVGYLQLRQYAEAQEAAQRAVQLGPNEARNWAGLARVFMALQSPIEARDAVDHALRADPDQVDALCAALQLASGEGRRKDEQAYTEQLGPRASHCPAADDEARSVTVNAAPVVRSGGAQRAR